MNGNSFKKQLFDYQNKVNDWIKFRKNKKGTQFNKEENTKIKFVVSLLDILGWNPLKGYDVEFEHHIPKVKGRDAADIALYISSEKHSKPVILIEVKPIQMPFKKEYPTKILEYMSRSKVRFGINTNGRELVLFHSYGVRHDAKSGCKLFSLELKDFIVYKDVLLMLSKRKVQEGVLDGFADEFHHGKKYGKKFSDWRRPEKKYRDPRYNKYILRLKFAKEFLKHNNQ
ncbi:MAG: type I restriction enzyme HsdR N-terminal domain-containing protein [Candidatus Omnitrophota bacterium]